MKTVNRSFVDPRLAKILMNQYKTYMDNPHPNLLVWVDPADLSAWYFLAVGLDAPYLGGEYIFKLTAPDVDAEKGKSAFPHTPPKFEVLTQNGIYQPGGSICISVGEFHTDDNPGKEGSYGWRPSLGMKGFASEVVNGMICYTELAKHGGVRILNLHDSLKNLYARMSRDENAKQYPMIATGFESLMDAYPDSVPVLNARDGRLRLAGKPIPIRSSSSVLQSTVASQSPLGGSVASVTSVAARQDNLSDYGNEETSQFIDDLLADDTDDAITANLASLALHGISSTGIDTAESLPDDDNVELTLLDENYATPKQISEAPHTVTTAADTPMSPVASTPTVATPTPTATATPTPTPVATAAAEPEAATPLQSSVMGVYDIIDSTDLLRAADHYASGGTTTITTIAVGSYSNGPDGDEEMDSLLSSLLDS